MTLRFHWSMSSADGKLKGATARAALSAVPNLDVLARFCRHAEECGIDSVLTAFGFHRADPIVLATALGMMTTRIKFMVAVRSGVFSPTAFVQQVNSVAALIDGRICINVVAGHTPNEQRYYGDFLSHDERYERTDEFLSICNAFWRREGEVDFEGRYYRIEKGKLNIPFLSPERTGPEIFLGGSSEQAERLAMKHAHCLWRLPDTPERLRERTQALAASGTETGLLVSLIVRETREEAVRAAYAMIESLGGEPKRTHEEFAKSSDSVAFTSTYAMAHQTDWVTPFLWTGAVPYLGAPAIAIIGSPDQVTEALFEFRNAGITQFLFMGWPDVEEMTIFARDVLPRVRAREASEESAVAMTLQPTG